MSLLIFHFFSSEIRPLFPASTNLTSRPLPPTGYCPLPGQEAKTLALSPSLGAKNPAIKFPSNFPFLTPRYPLPFRKCDLLFTAPLLRPHPPRWFLPPSSPPHAVAGFPNDRNPIFDVADLCFATADLWHFSRTSPIPRPLNTYHPPRVNLAPSYFPSDFLQSDSIKVVSIHLSTSSFPRWSSDPVTPFLANLDCVPYETQHGRPWTAPPTSSLPKMKVSNSLQSEIVGKNSRCTQNGWSMTENIVKLNHTFQNHSLSYFRYPAFMIPAINAIILFELHSELTDDEIWSRPRGKTLANPRDSFCFKVKSTRSSSHRQPWTYVPWPIEIPTEINQAHLSAATSKNPTHYLFAHNWPQWKHDPSTIEPPIGHPKEHMSVATLLLKINSNKLTLTNPTTRTSFVLPCFHDRMPTKLKDMSHGEEEILFSNKNPDPSSPSSVSSSNSSNSNLSFDSNSSDGSIECVQVVNPSFVPRFLNKLSEEKMEDIDEDEEFEDADEEAAEDSDPNFMDLDNNKHGRDVSSPPKEHKKGRTASTGEPSPNSRAASKPIACTDPNPPSRPPASVTNPYKTNTNSGSPAPPDSSKPPALVTPSKLDPIDISAKPQRPGKIYVKLLKALPENLASTATTPSPPNPTTLMSLLCPSLLQCSSR